MANRNELHKRQMIWAEYRAGSSNGQAKININAKLDPDFISDETIDGFYQRFQLDHISLSDRSSAHYGIPQAIQKLPNGDEKDFAEYIFLTSNDPRLTSRMATVDGRFAIFYDYRSSGNITIIFADLFHGKTKELEVEVIAQEEYRYIDSPKMIGQQHLLMRTWDGLLLLKINYETWEVNFVSRPNPGFRNIEHVLVDQLDSRKVFISGSDGFVTGNLIGDEIVFNTRREFPIHNVKCAKLIGNQLCGLRWFGHNETGDVIFQHCKIDLVTLTEETINVPITLNINFRDFSFPTGYYCRSVTRFYVAFYDRKTQDYIYALNTETLTWKHTGIIVYGRIISLFADQNEILTVQALHSCSQKSTFYRFPLKKPDSLKNLAWLTIRRSAFLFNSDLYNRICPRLPYGRGLRSLFISDFE